MWVIKTLLSGLDKRLGQIGSQTWLFDSIFPIQFLIAFANKKNICGQTIQVTQLTI